MTIRPREIARELITLILEGSGFEVESSETPFDIADKLTRFQPSVILLDLRMPGLTEDQLPAVVKSYRKACNGAVVLHSAHEPVEVARIVRDSGADGSIEKTDDDQLFVERVQEWTSRR